LRDAETDGIGAALARLDPERALVGLVHTDFCGENMVIDRDGRLHVIDNERMSLGALGLDVARSWYRWMLPPAAWESFRVNYRARMPHDDALRHFAFWALVATLKSAAVLLRLDPARAHVSIQRLRQAMADQDQVEL
jgi:thiamine kinase-like enzyme